MKQTIYIYIDDAIGTSAQLIGMLTAQAVKGREVFSFEFDDAWLRIVFDIAISNSDDHLRNHGFLLTKEGWSLSPAYDLNPQYYATNLSLNISENDSSMDYRLAKDVAPFFGISDTKADSIIQKVNDSVSSWRNIAGKYGISREEQEQMVRAFRTE